MRATCQFSCRGGPFGFSKAKPAAGTFSDIYAKEQRIRAVSTAVQGSASLGNEKSVSSTAVGYSAGARTLSETSQKASPTEQVLSLDIPYVQGGLTRQRNVSL